jgi:hypothetical protein
MQEEADQQTKSKADKIDAARKKVEEGSGSYCG